MTHTIHLRLRVSEGKRDEFLAFLQDAIPFYERHGDLRIRLLADPNDPDTFIEVVEYDSKEAYKRGQQEVESDPQMQEYLQQWRALLDGPPMVEVWEDATSLVKTEK